MTFLKQHPLFCALITTVAISKVVPTQTPGFLRVLQKVRQVPIVPLVLLLGVDSLDH